ncbi:MAG: hypothetical protein EA403_05385 [Spirochaetaceae bacterium]|nr:MAG: hypothetical protein EA403_05385 [Spirochaetaceae bacterium]
MKVVEHLVVPKSAAASRCEDGLVCTPDFAAVVDGATSKSDRTFADQSPGRTAMLLVRDAIATMDPKISAQEAMTFLDGTIRAWYEEQGLLDEMRTHVVRRCSAVLVVYSRYRGQIWSLGDCQALIDGVPVDKGSRPEEVLARVRSMVLYGELFRGRTVNQLLAHDTGREAILPLLERQVELQNSELDCEFGYSVLDGFLNRSDAVRVIPVSGDAREIVFASDGYPDVYPTLCETETALEEIIRTDPLCFSRFRATKGVYPGNRSFDDRCYLRIGLADQETVAQMKITSYVIE